jgi:hypothetical protein
MDVNVDVVILITLFFETNVLFNKMIIKKRHVNKSDWIIFFIKKVRPHRKHAF